MRRSVLLLAVGVLAITGCAKSDNGGPAPASHQPSAATQPPASPKINDHGTKTVTSETFNLELEQDNDGSDYYFKPTFIQAPGGSTATVTLKNEGDVPHNFTIEALDINETVAPAASKNVEVKLGSGTRVEFYCSFHKELGMRGAFLLH